MESETQHPAYDCNESDLGEMLHDLFKDEQVEEVVICHPKDGQEIVTRAQYMEYIKASARKVTGTQDEQEKMQTQFKQSLIFCDVRTIDISEDQNFGTDTKGRPIENIGGMVLVPASQYPPGCALLEKEVGCFFDEEGKRKTIRLITE